MTGSVAPTGEPITPASWPPPADDPRWQQLRAPFPPADLEWLPKQLRKGDLDKSRCERPNTGVCADERPCGGWHARSIHLAYVGHSGITQRLNAVDPTWTWEPMATTADGLPMVAAGVLWIRLTVLGATKLGVGDAGAKQGGDAVKEIIGDALRNAAMRFGVAAYLWSKSDAAAALRDGSGALDDQDQDHAEPADPDPLTALRLEVWRRLTEERGMSGDDARAAVGNALRVIGTDLETAGLDEWRAVADRLLGDPASTGPATTETASTNAKPASDRQLRTLGMLLSRFGITDTAERRFYTGELVGREIESSRELTASECSGVLDVLGNLLNAAGGRPPTYADTDVASARIALEALVANRAEGGDR